MFTKARNRILLLNMALVSAIMLAAFVVVYIAQYTRIQAENRSRVEMGGGVQVFGGTAVSAQPVTGPGAGGADDVNTSGTAIYHESNIINHSYVAITTNSGLFFYALADADGSILALDSVLDLPAETYQEIVDSAIAQNAESGSVTSGSSHWQYLISQVHYELHSEGSNVVETQTLLQLRFVDITDSQKTLSTLLFTLIALFFVLLVVFFFVSRFFANRAIRPMAEAWEKQNRFVADASHELRTPLSIIKANCGVLLSSQEETVGSQVKWINRINEGTGRMEGLIDDLLSLQNVEDAQFDVFISGCDLSVIADESTAAVEAAALEKGIALAENIEPGLHAQTDGERVRQLMSIMLDNAVKYTEAGGRVEIELKSTKKHLSFSVKNTGQGVPQAELAKLFDRFYRRDPARSSENAGYGLGLSIAKALAERLGGKLEAQSVEGESTTFTLKLPK